MTTPWPSAVLFDLDGTLIDSVPDITAAVAELLATEGLPQLDEAVVRRLVGRGMPNLVAGAFATRGRALDTKAHTAMVERMMAIYPRHLAGRTSLMPGTLAALDTLAARGCRLAVVTNKPQAFCVPVLQHVGLQHRFDLVLGDQPLTRTLRPKPAPDMLLFALERLETATSEAAMVGDSGNDIESGRAAGMATIAVRGGYTSVPLEEFHPSRVVETLAELPAALAEVAASAWAGRGQRQQPA